MVIQQTPAVNTSVKHQGTYWLSSCILPTQLSVFQWSFPPLLELSTRVGISFSASAVHLSLLPTMTPSPFSHHLLTFQHIPLPQNYFILTALWHIYKLLVLPPFLRPSKPQTLILFLFGSDSRAHNYHSLTLSPPSHSITLMWQPESY